MRIVEIVADNKNFLEMPDVRRWLPKAKLVAEGERFCIIQTPEIMTGQCYHFIRSHIHVVRFSEVETHAGNGAGR
jgi:hypothetical protein